MYVAITCCIMTCSISKGFVTYHGSMECEINYNYNYNKAWLTNMWPLRKVLVAVSHLNSSNNTM